MPFGYCDLRPVAALRNWCYVGFMNPDSEQAASPKQAVMVVVRDGGRVLVIQRAAGVPRPGYWTPVSGSIEPGEQQQDAVTREVFEEVGLSVTPTEKVWECPTDDGRYRLHWWLAERSRGVLRPDPREVAAARWIEPSAFAGLSPTFESHRRFFTDVFPQLG